MSVWRRWAPARGALSSLPWWWWWNMYAECSSKANTSKIAKKKCKLVQKFLIRHHRISSIRRISSFGKVSDLDMESVASLVSCCVIHLQLHMCDQSEWWQVYAVVQSRSGIIAWVATRCLHHVNRFATTLGVTPVKVSSATFVDRSSQQTAASVISLICYCAYILIN